MKNWAVFFILIVCLISLTAAYFLTPKHVPCNKDNFVASKRLQVAFEKKKPWCRFYQTLEVRYAGSQPAYVQPVGSYVDWRREGGVDLRQPFSRRNYLMLPGDTYRSNIPFERINIQFDYTLLEAKAYNADGAPATFRIAAPRTSAMIKL